MFLNFFYISWVFLSAASKSVTAILFLSTVAAPIGLKTIFVTLFFKEDNPFKYLIINNLFDFKDKLFFKFDEI